MGTVNVKSASQVQQEDYDRWPDRIAQKRWEVETGGITFTIPSSSEEVNVDTSRQSQSMITAAALQANKKTSSWTVKWKFSPGVFKSLTKSDIGKLSDAVATHVESAFDRESTLLELYKSGNITEDDLNTGW